MHLHLHLAVVEAVARLRKAGADEWNILDALICHAVELAAPIANSCLSTSLMGSRIAFGSARGLAIVGAILNFCASPAWRQGSAARLGRAIFRLIPNTRKVLRGSIWLLECNANDGNCSEL
jgi:hypothetical protein